MSHSNHSARRSGAFAAVFAFGLLASVTAQEFTNATELCGLAGPYVFGQYDGMMAGMMGGIAVSDYDGDGWEDIFWVAGAGQKARLFKNNGDGTFTDVAVEAGIDLQYPLTMPLWFDPDDDGDLDLLILNRAKVWSYSTGYEGFGMGMAGGVTPGSEPMETVVLPVPENRELKYEFMLEHTEYRNFYYQNQGDGTFLEKAKEAGLLHSGAFGVATGDVDGDGDIDLLGTTWTEGDSKTLLLLNDGTGRFRENTPRNMYETHTRGFAPRLVDMDNDGDLDAFWAGDFSTSKFFRNDGNLNFVDVTQEIGVGSDENGMGNAVGDINADGHLDWLVTAIYDEELLAQGVPDTSGNRVYLNDGTAHFTDATDAYGLRDGGWGWGAVLADIENDGDLDFFHVNGWGHLVPQHQQYTDDTFRAFVQGSHGFFTDMAADWGIDEPHQGRGMVAFDYDRDGKLDLLIGNNDTGMSLYRNRMGRSHNWLDVRLQGVTCNSQAIGARVTALTSFGPRLRVIEAGDNFMSQSPAGAWFGVRSDNEVDLRIKWPDGQINVISDVPTNQRVTIVEPDGPGNFAWEDIAP